MGRTSKHNTNISHCGSVPSVCTRRLCDHTLVYVVEWRENSSCSKMPRLTSPSEYFSRMYGSMNHSDRRSLSLWYTSLFPTRGFHSTRGVMWPLLW